MTTAILQRPTATPHRTVKDRMPPTCGEHAAIRQAGCPTCQARAAWYNRQRRRQVRAGTWEPLTPVEPIADHIHSLLAAGWTMRQIIERAGVDGGAVSEIRDGRRTRGVTAFMAAALLGVTGPAPDRWSVPAIGTHRRLRALGAIGYARPYIARRLGVSRKAVDEWLYSDRVTVATRDKVIALYDELSAIPGPSKVARARARHFGYAPPLAWDDIDDPNEQPNLGAPSSRDDSYDETTVALAVEGRLTYAQLNAHRPDLIEAVRRLARTLGDLEIAHRLRVPGAGEVMEGYKTRGQSTVTGIRARAGIPACPRQESIAPRIRRSATTKAA